MLNDLSKEWLLLDRCLEEMKLPAKRPSRAKGTMQPELVQLPTVKLQETLSRLQDELDGYEALVVPMVESNMVPLTTKDTYTPGMSYWSPSMTSEDKEDHDISFEAGHWVSKGGGTPDPCAIMS